MPQSSSYRVTRRLDYQNFSFTSPISHQSRLGHQIFWVFNFRYQLSFVARVPCHKPPAANHRLLVLCHHPQIRLCVGELEAAAGRTLRGKVGQPVLCVFKYQARPNYFFVSCFLYTKRTRSHRLAHISRWLHARRLYHICHEALVLKFAMFPTRSPLSQQRFLGVPHADPGAVYQQVRRAGKDGAHRPA